MDSKCLLGFLEEFKATHELYFQKFSDLFHSTPETNAVFGSAELNQLCINAQCLLSFLGVRAKERMIYIGFFELYCFDNPVDWYVWKEKVKSKEVPYTVFCSIALRMDSEIERIRIFLERDMWSAYQELSSHEFLVSVNKYPYFEINLTLGEGESKKSESLILVKDNINNMLSDSIIQNEKLAMEKLDKTQKQIGIWSNAIDVIKKLLG